MKYLVLGIKAPHLPLLEGLVGFASLGVVLISLSLLEKWGIVSVNEGVITVGLLSGIVIGICLLLFKSIFLLGL